MPEDEGFQTLSDLEESAARRVDPKVWAHVQGGAGEQRTLRWNREAFLARTLRPRVLVDVSEVRTAHRILGRPVDAPFFISPTSQHGLLHPEAESATARAAAGRNLLAVYSTLSTRSLEEIAEAAPRGPRWFQLYVHQDPAITKDLLRRAEASGYQAIVVTVDAPVLGVRDAQDRAGFVMPPGIPLGNLDRYGSMKAHEGSLRQADHFSRRTDPAMSWDRLAEVRAGTRLPLILKGVLTAEDTERAVDAGVSGIVVSNHGGRQLDGAPATLWVLPEVVRASRGRLEVYLDGGVRRGADVLVALAMGARAVGLGRPILWGLAAGGEAGVGRVLDLLRKDLETSMALTGCREVSEIRPEMVGGVPRDG